MINENIQIEIVKCVANEFSEKERKAFIKTLVDECNGNETDLIDCINVKNTDDYWKLCTIVRDRYINAYFKMHINGGR